MKKIILMLVLIFETFAFSEITTKAFSHQILKFIFQIKKTGFMVKYQEQMSRIGKNSTILST